MSDILSALTSSLQSASASNSNQSASDKLVAAYRATRQSELDTLKSKKTSLEQNQTFYNTLKTKLGTLVNQIDIFTAENAPSKFITRNITSSDSAVMTATAGSEAVVGMSTAKVSRLASNDMLVSKQMNLSDTFGGLSGTKQFDLTIDDETYNFSVELDGTETNEQVMKKIANAVNLNTDADVTATYIKDTKTTGRLTFTSKNTGSDANVRFSESLAEANPDNRLLGRLGLIAADLNPGSTSRTTSTATGAGYKTADINTLDAQLEMNGITVTRGSNTIDDLMPGVTLTLLKPQEADDLPVTLQTSVNTAGVESLVKPLLDSYNDIIKYIKSNTSMLRKDSSVSSLYSRLRSTITQVVSSANEGDPKYLTEAGIKIGSDGTLSIGDREDLETLLKNDPTKVSNLFTSSDGFVNKLNDSIANLLGDNGLIKNKTKSLASQIDSTSKRYAELEAKIDRSAESMRDEYESMLRSYLQAQNQYTMLGNYYQSGQ